MKRITLAIAFTIGLGAAPAFAQAGFYLPSAAPTSGQDEFRAADGTTCRSTMDGTKRVEVGAFGSGGKNDGYGYGGGLSGYDRPTSGNAGVYGRFTMSLDAAPDRMNCNLLYKLELERRQLELELMKRSLASADRRLDDQMSGADQMSEAPAPTAVPASRVARKPLPQAPKAASAPVKAITPTKVANAPKRGFPPP